MADIHQGRHDPLDNGLKTPVSDEAQRISSFFSALKSDDVWVKVAAIESFKGTREPIVLQALCEIALKDPDDNVRDSAAASIRGTTVRGTLDWLCQEGLVDPDARIRVAAISALGGTSDQSASTALCKLLLTDPSFEVAEAAAYCLHGVSHQAAIDLLCREGLRHPDNDVRWRSVVALAGTTNVLALRELCETDGIGLRDSERRVRRAAARGLTGTKYLPARNALRAAVRGDVDPEVQEYADEAIQFWNVKSFKLPNLPPQIVQNWLESSAVRVRSVCAPASLLQVVYENVEEIGLSKLKTFSRNQTPGNRLAHEIQGWLQATGANMTAIADMPGSPFLFAFYESGPASEPLNVKEFNFRETSLIGLPYVIDAWLAKSAVRIKSAVAPHDCALVEMLYETAEISGTTKMQVFNYRETTQFGLAGKIRSWLQETNAVVVAACAPAGSSIVLLFYESDPAKAGSKVKELNCKEPGNALQVWLEETGAAATAIVQPRGSTELLIFHDADEAASKAPAGQS